MTRSRRNSTTFSKAKISSKEDHNDSLVVCVWFITISWILAKLLQLKCTANSMKCTKNFNVCVQHCSTEMVLSFSTIILRHTSPNRSFKNWTIWPTKLYFISYPPITIFSSISTTFYIKNASNPRKILKQQWVCCLQDSRILFNWNNKNCSSLGKVHWLEWFLF